MLQRQENRPFHSCSESPSLRAPTSMRVEQLYRGTINTINRASVGFFTTFRKEKPQSLRTEKWEVFVGGVLLEYLLLERGGRGRLTHQKRNVGLPGGLYWPLRAEYSLSFPPHR